MGHIEFFSELGAKLPGVFTYEPNLQLFAREFAVVSLAK